MTGEALCHAVRCSVKSLMLVLILFVPSAFGQDQAAMAAQAAQQANDIAMQATQTALQMQQQALQTTLLNQQMMANTADLFFPQSPGPAIGVALPPAFSFKSGKVAAGSQVTLRSQTHYATIYYTADGWTPNARSPRYTGPIIITGETHIQAIAVGPDLLHSSVARVDYWTTSPAAQSAVPSAPPVPLAAVTLRAGETLHLTTSAEVSSKTAEVGDKVPMTLAQDLTDAGRVLAAKGTAVDAVLIVADPAGRRGVPGDLVFEVRSLQAAGKTIPLQGGEILEGNGSTRNSEEAVIEPGMMLISRVAEAKP